MDIKIQRKEGDGMDALVQLASELSPTKVVDSETNKIVFGDNDNIETLLQALVGSDCFLMDQYLTNPLKDIAHINRRLDAIEELVTNSDIRENVGDVVDAFGMLVSGEIFRAIMKYIEYVSSMPHWAQREIPNVIHALGSTQEFSL